MAKNPVIMSSNLESAFQSLRRGQSPQYNVPSNDDYKAIPNQNYPLGDSSKGALNSYGLNKYASAGGGGTIYGQPQFFSPVHTPINWQIPSKRLEQYQWARFFYENEPKVAAAIDFYSYFPMNDYNHECKDPSVKNHFDKLKKHLEIAKWLRLISHEIHKLGDCFPLVEISCEHCHGTGRIGDEICEHEGGTVKRIVILNPDYVEVYTSSLNPDPVIALKADEELTNMVTGKVPGSERLTPQVRALISSGQPIRLDNRNVSHLMYGEGGYDKYGTGMIRRLFPILSYKTKLMVAQWIVAERLIVPIKIVKVGNEDRPAGPADIAAVQEQLAQTANDPNLTIVTHHAFDLEWYGACYDEETEVLTENGWKKYEAVSKDYDEKIASYNKETGQVEYQVPQEYHEYEYNGELCSFQSRYYDIMVTPNHKMLASTRVWNNSDNKYSHSEWKEVRADNITENSRFNTSVLWEGIIPEELPYKSEVGFEDLILDDYLKFIGYYLSEGGLKSDNAVCITQKEDSPCYNSIKDVMQKVSSKIQYSEDTRSTPSCWSMYINNSEIARSISKIYGSHSDLKKIPKWVLNLPKRELGVLLGALMDGDGSVRFSSGGSPRFSYSTVSRELSDQVQEIVLKLGYFPNTALEPIDMENRKDIYRIHWTEAIKKAGYVSVKDRNIGRKVYNGKVWCFTVPNGFFITRRNGKVTIQGNSGKVLTLSNEFDFINQEILDGMMINNALLNGEGPNYSSASIGIESTIERLESFRREIAAWVEKNIYLPEAIRHDFKEVDPETGEIEYIYPKIKWNSMHLRDQQQYRQLVLQLYEKGLLSAQTVLEICGFDADQEIERKRYDALQQGALAGGMGGGMGGGFAGDMGGLPGGGMDIGGMGGMEAGGMEGGAGAGGMEGGGMEGGAGAGGMEGGAPTASSDRQIKVAQSQDDTANPEEFGGKILKKKTRDRYLSDQQKTLKKNEPSQGENKHYGPERDLKGRVIFTEPEMELLDGLVRYQKDGLIKYQIIPQVPIQYGGREYPVDFAIIPLKIAIEADGELFHSNYKQIKHDKERDMKLNQLGWTVLRFKDEEIKKRLEGVMQTVLKTIMKKEMYLKKALEKK